MIDIRHGYAIARRFGQTYCIATDRCLHPSAPGSFSTNICVENNLEPVRRRKAEMEKTGAAPGLVIIRITDDLISEVGLEARS